MYFKISQVIFVISLALVACGAQDADKDLMNIINTVDSEQSLPLFGGLSIEKVETGRSLNEDSVAAESVIDRAEQYLNTHELKFNLPEDETEENERTGRSHVTDEARSGKLKKIVLPLLLALKLKFSLIFKLMLLAVKFVSFKALFVGTIALLFSGATLFKDLLAKKQERITTAYLTGSSPLNAEIVHQSDWNRNGQASAQELAYNYHTVPQGVY